MPEYKEDDNHVHEALEGRVYSQAIVEVLHDHVFLVGFLEQSHHSCQPNEFIQSSNAAESCEAIDVPRLGYQIYWEQ